MQRVTSSMVSPSLQHLFGFSTEPQYRHSQSPNLRLRLQGAAAVCHVEAIDRPTVHTSRPPSSSRSSSGFAPLVRLSRRHAPFDKTGHALERHSAVLHRSPLILRRLLPTRNPLGGGDVT
ncbi:hypothetical protein BV25DRAFT_412443 [Artomyces pyxidatus]|uniref:Uncharacterized protein n=1 Tax=Artomyces pyxidatus TaxID=48021 RepID=A0ACB8T3H7_9AGAM|nr:hypothetical protein BV25DRAFT_412443 [Artomyces pyxidatus]